MRTILVAAVLVFSSVAAGNATTMTPPAHVQLELDQQTWKDSAAWRELSAECQEEVQRWRKILADMSTAT